jgi:type VI protein secretion system component Hcp
MFIQISEGEFVNANRIVLVRKETSGNQTSYYFYTANKELIAQTDWNDTSFHEVIERGLRKIGLVAKAEPGKGALE